MAPSQAGRGPAEGLDLGGVVVGLVFEHHQPLLLLSVHIYRHHDAASVDLVGQIEVSLSFPSGLQLLHGQSGDIHEADRFFPAQFVPVG